MAPASTQREPRMSLSSFCRYQEHARCTRAKAKCACKCHGKPRLQEVETPDEVEEPRPNPIQRSPRAREEPPKKRHTEPTIRLVKADPPPRATAPNLVARCAKELEAVRVDPGAWYRILDYDGSSTSANSGASALRKGTTGFEFKAAAGAVYARYVGDTASSTSPDQP